MFLRRDLLCFYCTFVEGIFEVAVKFVKMMNVGRNYL